MEKKSKINYTIEIWRFLACIQIVLLHFYHAGFMYKEHVDLPFLGNYIFVEFFFILSGYLFMDRYMDPVNTKKTVSSLLLAKIKRLYPHYIFSFLCFFMVYNVFIFKFKNFPQRAAEAFWEMFMLPMTGIGNYVYNGVTWYVSVVLIVSFLVLSAFKYWQTVCVSIFIPLLVFLVYGYLFHTFSWVGSWKYWNGFCMNGLLRGVAGFGLGIIGHITVSKINSIKINRYSIKIVLTFLEWIIFIITFIVANARSNDNIDFLIIFLYFISICLSFSKFSCSDVLFQNKFITYLGKLSYPIYLNHWLVMRLYAFSFAENHSVITFIIYFLILFIYSVITYFVVKKGVGLISKSVKRILSQ